MKHIRSRYREAGPLLLSLVWAAGALRQECEDGNPLLQDMQDAVDAERARCNYEVGNTNCIVLYSRINNHIPRTVYDCTQSPDERADLRADHCIFVERGAV